MKKFSVNCDFGGQMSPFAVYIGIPEGSHHPLHFQADWLSKNRGGNIPNEFMEAVSQLQHIADKNKVSLEELCVYALGAAQQEKEDGISLSENPDMIGSSVDNFDTQYTDEDDDLDDLFDFDDLVAEPGDDGVGVSDEEMAEIDKEFELDDEYLNKLFTDIESKEADLIDHTPELPSKSEDEVNSIAENQFSEYNPEITDYKLSEEIDLLDDEFFENNKDILEGDEPTLDDELTSLIDTHNKRKSKDELSAKEPSESHTSESITNVKPEDSNK